MAPATTPVRKTPNQHSSGFSLLGLILWLSGLSVVAAIAVPMFFERSIVTLENGAVLLASDLRSAQNRAAYSGQILFMRFFEDGDGYEVVGQDNEPIMDPRTGRPFVRHYSIDGVFEGLRIAELNVNDGRTLVFSKTGETSGRLECVLDFEGETRRLLSERKTGIVTIEGSTSGFVDDGY
ncbi:MAG: Tfp pilus assembly protein FimT [Bacteroidia bacterium]